jgi:hypothetical protein
MSEEKGEFLSIPSFIRAMIEPYRNIMAPQPDIPEPRRLERTFIEEIFRPTPKQLEAIGRVASAWAVMERVMAITVARLALAPDFTTLALTRELTANSQIKVLRNLIPLHLERYGCEIANRNLLEDLKTLPSKIDKLKDERNVVAHTVWLKKNEDAISALRERPTTASKSASEPPITKTINEINQLATDIWALADKLFIFAQFLPAVDEVRHAQSLAENAQTLYREIGSAHQHPPQSSGE